MRSDAELFLAHVITQPLIQTKSFSFFLHLWYNAAEKRDGEDARHVLSLLFVEKRRHWLKAI
jgi:hypothetical protein